MWSKHATASVSEQCLACQDQIKDFRYWTYNKLYLVSHYLLVISFTVCSQIHRCDRPDHKWKNNWAVVKAYGHWHVTGFPHLLRGISTNSPVICDYLGI